MTWTLTVARDAEKNLRDIPARDRNRLLAALQQMRDDPFSGDVVRLRAQPVAYRRRVGNYRILFDVDTEEQVAQVQDVVRRTSTTY